MTALASALPGLRDVRAPVSAGYLWLAVAWLAVGPDVDTAPGSDVGRALFDLADAVGTVGVGVAVSVVAYIAGIVSQEISDQLVKPLVRRRSRADAEIRQHVQNVYDNAFDRIEALSLSKEEKAPLHDKLESLRNATVGEVRAQLRLPVTVLLDSDEQLLGAVDRRRAEAEFRTAVSLPLLGMAAVLAGDGHFVSAAALVPMALAIGAQGVRRAVESEALIASTVLLERVTLPVMSGYRDEVERLTDQATQAARPVAA